MKPSLTISLGTAALAAVVIAGPTAHAADLTLRHATLSLGGVGYFEYAAQTGGDPMLGLDLRRDQVSDALKSLVVLDGAGTVSLAELPGEDGASPAFAALPFGPAAFATPLALLTGLQGAQITARGRALPGGMLQGRLVRAVSEDLVQAGSPARSSPRTRVTLLTEAGLQQIVLEEADSVQPSDPALRDRIARALDAVLADSGGQAAGQRRHLTLRATGTGDRLIRVGIVVAAPLWKTSYRLMLPGDPAGEKARLQGWAVLENDTPSDWDDVEIALQSGNPVTFRQALYSIFRVARPEVPVEVFGRALPPPDAGATMMTITRARRAGPPSPAAAPLAGAMRSAPDAAADEPPPPPAPPAETAAVSEGVAATAFTLPARLTLPAGHTATTPILDRPVSARRVNLLAAGQIHPAAAVRLVNESGASLPPGAVTVYDATGFAGDARLGPLPDGEARLLSYAEDLRTTADWNTGHTTTLMGLTAAKGVLHVLRRQRTTTTVTIQAPGAESRDLLVEVPRTPDATLTADAAGTIEQTATGWRIPLSLRPGEKRVVVAHADTRATEDTAIADDPDIVVRVLNEQALDPAARAALGRVASLRAESDARNTVRDQLAAEREAAEHEEERLRLNLAAIPATDALHARLVRSLEAAEDHLTALSPKQAAAREAADRARSALADAVATLSF